ncbi:telomeric repeat binding factor a [Epinephelus moara]|uniref:telomeric repeat binding factor a n=1 Tax=Epinephelus moara TaxID=300413 RepID=UPI00214EEB83|nr:telomeric repeat binding factor a [Epinephelus moara]
MAASDVQDIVNRWILDYYFALAIELFRNQQYAEFCAIREVLEGVLVRPLESSDVTPTKIHVLQFLSRINDGEKLDLIFEPDHSVTPLESALMLLEKMNQQCSVPGQNFENACTSLKEMMVWMFIKNDQFDRAEEVLKKHFPRPMIGKKAIFMGLIRKKSKTHEVTEQLDFQQFKEEMLTFCQSLCPFSVPFLLKAAKQLSEKRLQQQDDEVAGPDEQDETGLDEQDEAGPSSSPAVAVQSKLTLCKHRTIPRARLEAAYKALAAGSNERTFSELEEEVEVEEQSKKEFSLHLSQTPAKGTDQDTEQDGLFQRDSGSPMEASPADQPPQTDAVPPTQAGSDSRCCPVLKNRRPYTVARLVVEPDSQGSLHCSAASQELEIDVRTEEPPQSPAITNNKDPQSLGKDTEVTTHVQKASTSLAELSADGEEDAPVSVANRDISEGKSQNQSNSSRCRNSKSHQSSSDSEEDPLESPAPRKTPVRKPRKRLAKDPHSKDPDATCVTESSLESSPTLFPLRSPVPVPQTSSTPHKDSAQDKDPSGLKWKQLFNAAKETKDTWSDEESYFTSKQKASGSHNESTMSNSGNRKRRWTESETNKLKKGVKRFGEGNWSKIKSYYSFNDRTNVNLKDRWRTMKKLKLV